jgi:hypothetical protein
VLYETQQNENNLACILHRDGVQWIRFNKGIDITETSKMVGILNQYRTLPADPDGDIVTAFWEADFKYIEYDAVDSTLEDDAEPDNPFPSLTSGGRSESLPVPSPAEAEGSGAEGSGAEDQEQDVGLGSVELTDEDKANLVELVTAEMDRDPTLDVIIMVTDILLEEEDQESFTFVLEYLEQEIANSLERLDIEVPIKIFQNLDRIRRACKESGSLAQSEIDTFILEASRSENLTLLEAMWHGAGMERLAKIREYLLFLQPPAICCLGPLLKKEKSQPVISMLSDVIATLAARDFAPLQTLLRGAEEGLAIKLIKILAHMEDELSAQALLDTLNHPSDPVRRNTLSAVMSRDVWDPRRVFALIDDTDPIKRLVLHYLGSRKCETAEDLLVTYLKDHKFAKGEVDLCLAAYRALGRSGGGRSLPFLREALLRGNWLSKFLASANRQAAAIALQTIGTDQAGQILNEACRSPFPAIRGAVSAARGKVQAIGAQQ